jgi:Flagellar basal body-associated protein
MSAAIAALGASLKKGRMKIVLIMAVLLLLLGTAALVASRSVVPVDEEDAEFEAEHQAKPGAYDAKSAPVFVQLETFTANLADRDSDRFIQVGVTLEVVDPKAAEQIKAFMPVIRNNILLVLTNKTSDAVREPVGKRRLAAEIRAQALRPLGHSVKVEELLDEEPSGSFRQAKWARLPIKAVHFSTFIVQ